MSLHVTSASPPASLTHCPVGANPIIWINDDFPELGDETTLDACLSDMRAAGYAGTELGRKFPRSAPELAATLQRHDLRLVSGWHSTFLAERPLAEERVRFAAHLELLRVTGATVVIVAECTRAVHGERRVSLGFGDEDRPRLTEREWLRVTEGLQEFAEQTAAAGLKLVYHHHMGTVVQSGSELDRLLAAVPGLFLLLDPGHLAFAGVDPSAVIRRHAARVAHVHLKSVRPEVVQRARTERWSFYRAVCEGVFTIPGDGAVDFDRIFGALAEVNYRGWLVVEAEEDPAKAPPTRKAAQARAYVHAHAGA